MTNAFFHAKGGLPTLSVLFTKLAITQVNSTAQCLKTQYGILSNLGAVFFNSNQKVIYLVFRDSMSNESIFMNRFNDSIYLVSVIML